MHKKFIGLILAASITVTGFTAAPARADDATAQAIVGLLGLALMATALDNGDHKKKKKVYVGQPREKVYKHKPQHREVIHRDSRRGHDYGRRDHGRSSRHAATLPRQCKRFDGHRAYYSAGCLRRNGYITGRR